jgi:hypothetical protein
MNSISASCSLSRPFLRKTEESVIEPARARRSPVVGRAVRAPRADAI